MANPLDLYVDQHVNLGIVSEGYLSFEDIPTLRNSINEYEEAFQGTLVSLKNAWEGQDSIEARMALLAIQLAAETLVGDGNVSQEAKQLLETIRISGGRQAFWNENQHLLAAFEQSVGVLTGFVEGLKQRLPDQQEGAGVENATFDRSSSSEDRFGSSSSSSSDDDDDAADAINRINAIILEVLRDQDVDDPSRLAPPAA